MGLIIRMVKNTLMKGQIIHISNILEKATIKDFAWPRGF